MTETTILSLYTFATATLRAIFGGQRSAQFHLWPTWGAARRDGALHSFNAFIALLPRPLFSERDLCAHIRWLWFLRIPAGQSTSEIWLSANKSLNTFDEIKVSDRLRSNARLL